MNKLKVFFIGDILARIQDTREQARAEVNFYFSFYSLICFTLVFISMLVLGAYPVLIPSGISALFCVIHLLILRTFSDVRLASTIFSVLIFTVLFGNMFFNINTLHFGGPLWMVVLILFVIFNLGRKAGLVIAFACVAFFTLFTMTVLPENIRLAREFDPGIYYSLGAELLIALLIIYYLVNVFVRTNLRIQFELENSNTHLENQNKLIKRQHQEKEIMLREIHHRVKNNLQVINSMLRLQSEKVKDAHANAIFEEAQHRIIAMSIVHERMYKADNLSTIHLGEYMKQLAEDLINQHVTTQKIQLDITSVSDEIDVQRIVPLGLILNELIANSLKHGIKEEGSVRIVFEKTTHGVHFLYCDDGAGFSENYEGGFGLELIELLTEQLDGTMSIDSNVEKGVCFHFHFPEK